MEQTLDEYLFKLGKYKEDAYENGNVRLGDFLEHLIGYKNADIGVLDVIYHCYDDLHDCDAELFDYLLSNGASKDWYDAATYIADQRGKCKDYIPVIERAFENGLAASDLMLAENKTSSFDEFVELIESTILKFGIHTDENSLPTGDNKLRIENEFIKHLKIENDRLQKQLDAKSAELESLQTVHRSTIEESVANKHIASDSVHELDDIKKQLKNLMIEKSRFEKKYFSRKSYAESLESVNDTLLNDKNSLMTERHNLLQRIDGYISERSKLIEDKEALFGEKEQLAKDLSIVSKERDLALEARDNAIDKLDEVMNNDLSGENTSLKEQNTEFTEQITSLTNECTALKTGFEGLNEKYKKLLADFEMGIAENERLAGIIESLKQGNVSVNQPSGITGQAAAQTAQSAPSAMTYANVTPTVQIQPPIPSQTPNYSYDGVDFGGVGFDDGGFGVNPGTSDYGTNDFYSAASVEQNNTGLIEYDPNEVIAFLSREEAIEKKRSIAKTVFSSFNKFYFSFIFKLKSIEEQNNLIWMLLVKRNYPRDVTRQIAGALRNKPDISRATIYKLLQKNSSADELLAYCGGL